MRLLSGWHGGAGQSDCAVVVSIAVIGSGASTKGKCLGADIDAHDIVIRMHGQQPTDANLSDLGKKWTWLASGLKREHNGVPFIHHIEVGTEKVLCVHWAEKYGSRENTLPERHRHLIEWMPFEWANECQIELGAWPTSGMFLLFWLKKRGLLSDCDIYGIDGYKTGYHSGAQVDPRAHKIHRFEKERAVFDKLRPLVNSWQ